MRFLRLLVRAFLILTLTPVVLIFAFQDKMIYHPRRYQEALRPAVEGKDPSIKPLRYTTSQGAQESYYIPPRSGAHGGLPTNLWVFFNGNGSLALEWMRIIQSYPSADDAFLLFEYPGYGNCAGTPSSRYIQESANTAFTALAAHLGVPVAQLEPRLKVLGHSLGCATGLAFASAHPVSRVVLVAPFSSLDDMARLTVGSPLCYLLRDNFDNRSRLSEISHRTPAPSVEILSGTRDRVIPFTMGRELAGISPVVRFQPITGAGHNDILDATDHLFAAMRGTASNSPLATPR